MKILPFFFMALFLVSLSSHADTDVRNQAILHSPKIKAKLAKLDRVYKLHCVFSYDSTNNLMVSYFDENNLSKYELTTGCDDTGFTNLIIKGVLGDSGETTIETTYFTNLIVK